MTLSLMCTKTRDQFWMQHALRLADEAEAAGEVPVGAVLVRDNEVIGEGFNQPIRFHDPTAHAEVVALRAAGRQHQNYRLPGTTLYVTLEPCVMCVGAILHARVERVVFGAWDPRAGALDSALQVAKTASLNHRLEWAGGIEADACSNKLTVFFKGKR